MGKSLFSLFCHWDSLPPDISHPQDILGFMWHQKGGDGTFDNWCLRFDEREAFDRFQSRFARCLWEVKNEVPWEKAIREDQEYAVAVWEGEDVEMASLSDGENESAETSEDEEDEVKDSLRGGRMSIRGISPLLMRYGHF